MSSSIAIPRRRKQLGQSSSGSPVATPSSSTSFSPSSFEYGSFDSSSSGSLKNSYDASLDLKAERAERRGEGERRPSLMSAAFTKAEHTVVNVGNSELPRLITCVKASQGFDWNQEIFLPSYADVHFDDLEHKQDPVEDIVLTDEEVAKILPS